MRELRSVLDEAEADRALLQKARRGLQTELETIKMDAVDPTRTNSDQKVKAMQQQIDSMVSSLTEEGSGFQTVDVEC